MSKRAIRKKLDSNGTEGGHPPAVPPAPDPSSTDLDWRAAGSLPLLRELRTYANALDRLISRKDEHVLIKGGDVIGIYPDRELAVREAIDRFGAEPVLIKRIVEAEPVLEIGHVNL